MFQHHQNSANINLDTQNQEIRFGGRKTFALTQQEIIDLDKHIRALPFKRRMQDAFLAMISERESMKQLNEEDLKLIQRCRYERNTYNKRIVQLQLIQKPSHRN
ncbi:hypothetical protein [Acinetobacter sp. 1564232]|uniref:hypothetical protein n=1 Tax=Acinetobacter sp. 1564232 TaxID=1310723 RepID=UPI0004465D1D|nr:hypothetical protein [Acinetobacter sp. 1564232]EYT24203.1 hypothetical protein J622_03800 [Acinetobacter sp. 1564232]